MLYEVGYTGLEPVGQSSLTNRCQAMGGFAAEFTHINDPCDHHTEFLNQVGHTGLEPVTSALSRQRSKPTELMTHNYYKYAKIMSC